MMRKRLTDALHASKESSNKACGEYVNKANKKKTIKSVPAAKITCETHTKADRWGIYSLAYKDDLGSEVAVGFGNGAITLYNALNGNNLKEIAPGQTFGYAAMSLTFTNNKNHIISTSAGGDVCLWSTKNSKQNPLLIAHEEKNEVNALDICKEGSFFATAGKDRKIRIYDTKQFTLCSSSKPPDYLTMDDHDKLAGHSKRIFAVRFHPSHNNIFLSGGWDNCVKIWDKRILRTAKQSLNGPHICGKSIDVVDNTILTGSWTAKSALQLWDMRTGKIFETLPFIKHNVYHGEFIYCAKFANKNTVLAGGSGTNGVCSISIPFKTVKNETVLDKPCYAIDSCNGGKKAALGGLCNKVVQVYT